MLFALCVLASAAYVTPMAKAQASLNISPDQGPPGTPITLSAQGFVPDSEVLITLQSGESVTSTAVADGSGNLNVQTSIPSDAKVGATSIVATDDASPYTVATGPFTITSGSGSSSATPTANPEATATPLYTYQPTLPPVASGSGIGSSTLIGIIAVVIVVACVIPAALLYRGRSNRRPLREEERPRYGPEPAPAPYGPQVGPAFNQAPPSSYRPQSSSSSVYQRFNQPSSSARSSTYSRYGQSSSYSQRSTPSGYRGSSVYSKTCPNCRRTVRSDQTVCPFCGKRIF